MAYQDLRAFLIRLEQSGELVDVSCHCVEVDVAKALAKSNSVQGPALMLNQTGTDFPLVAGIYAARRGALLAFDATEHTIFDKVLKGINNPVGPVDLRARPLVRIVVVGDQIDVTKLPVPIYSPKDGGPYITAHRGLRGSRNVDPRISAFTAFWSMAPSIGRVFGAHHRFGKNIAQATAMGVPLMERSSSASTP